MANPILTDTIDAATDPAPTKPGVINGAKATLAYVFMSNCTSIAAAVATEVTRGRVDWRVLGIKVTLYDELRERRISQLSGVEWTCLNTDARQVRLSLDIPCYRGNWHYDAIFITTDVLEAALRMNGVVPVGHRADGVRWWANDPSLVVGVLGENGDLVGVGQDLWILSHRTYPLVWVLETFQMFKLGREGG